MNKLCRYKGILTVLIPHNLHYLTYPMEDYDFDMPERVPTTDPNIEMIAIAKLHFSEARAIIRLLIDDVSIVEPTPAPNLTFKIKADKPALGLHALYNKEY